MFPRDEVLSRHRLPAPYRGALTLLWLLPGLLLAGALLVSRGPQVALLDPRLLLPLCLMLLPALFVWRQGIDLGQRGLWLRLSLPSYHAYDALSEWRLLHTPQGRILGIYARDESILCHWHALHLSDCDALLEILRQKLG